MADRILTGCEGLDEVLGGGIPPNTISVIMGAPGTGKTILAEQLAFANATPEHPALYLTTLSEPLEKIIAHGQTQEFFDSNKVGVSMHYEDLGLMLRESGVDQLPEMVTNLLMERRPGFIFIDSFKALTELMLTPQQRRTVIYDLASVLSAYQCTSFLIGEYAQETMTELPEFAIADVVLQLMKYSTNVSEQRFLRVEKLRGSGSIPGMHAFAIGREGVKVYPRLLTPTISPNYSAKVERVNTGIANLDGMISEGFWRGSTTLIAGPTGSGKTIIGLHFITHGALKGEQGLYVGFQENPTQLSRVMKNLGWHPEKLLNGGGFDLLYKSPVELQGDTVTSEIFRRVRDGKVKRVVIDALGDLERSSVDRQRFADFIYALTQWFAAENVTCLMMYELTNLFEVHGISDQEISNMADNVILLRFTPGPEMQRTLRIIKTRGSAHDNREHELQITNKGVVVKKA
ncbi:MAG TPA: ATPase domain-containing protein [Pyrinomonadaceae bacterium]|jgi:circadian clock protein KaiC|nr:ATPase domain-containing protein [Pyrinomonadaceae bacterium]